MELVHYGFIHEVSCFHGPGQAPSAGIAARGPVPALHP